MRKDDVLRKGKLVNLFRRETAYDGRAELKKRDGRSAIPLFNKSRLCR
jgi:hypothetical protein